MEKDLFYENIKKDPEKRKVFEDAREIGLIQPFDPEVLTRLRRTYYGGLSGLLYLYAFSTTSETIGTKIEILSYVFEEQEYTILHGDTDSTKMMSNCRMSEKLDYNSWIEVQKKRKIWVYDTFSMRKIEKGIYYRLERPKVHREIPRRVIQSISTRDENNLSLSELDDSLLFLPIVSQIENSLEKNPYYKFLKPELERYKEIVKYKEKVLEWKQIQAH